MKKDYRQLFIEADVQLDRVLEFLKEGTIADYQLVAKIFGDGMTESDFRDLQDAITELEMDLKEFEKDEEI